MDKLTLDDIRKLDAEREWEICNVLGEHFEHLRSKTDGVTLVQLVGVSPNLAYEVIRDNIYCGGPDEVLEAGFRAGYGRMAAELVNDYDAFVGQESKLLLVLPYMEDHEVIMMLDMSWLTGTTRDRIMRERGITRDRRGDLCLERDLEDIEEYPEDYDDDPSARRFQHFLNRRGGLKNSRY